MPSMSVNALKASNLRNRLTVFTMGQLDLAYRLHRQQFLVTLEVVSRTTLRGLPRWVNFRCRLPRWGGCYFISIHIFDWTLLQHWELKPGFAVSDSIRTVPHCHGSSIATAHNQTKISVDERAMGNCAVNCLSMAVHDSLQSVRVDKEPFPPHLHSGVFHVYPGTTDVQPDTLIIRPHDERPAETGFSDLSYQAGPCPL